MKIHLTLISLAVFTSVFFSCNNNAKVNNDQTAVTVADSSVVPAIAPDKLDSLVTLIIDIAANDFYKNQQPAPVAFKNVTLKYIKKTSGEELYILCGQFVTADKEEIQFATVKNIDYEQWVGTSALTYCQDTQEIPYTKADLSAALKDKFDGLKKQ